MSNRQGSGEHLGMEQVGTWSRVALEMSLWLWIREVVIVGCLTSKGYHVHMQLLPYMIEGCNHLILSQNISKEICNLPPTFSALSHSKGRTIRKSIPWRSSFLRKYLRNS